MAEGVRCLFDFQLEVGREVYTRETGTIWQISVLTAERSISTTYPQNAKMYTVSTLERQFAENVRNGQKSTFFDQKSLRSAVKTPNCQIVPVSRAWRCVGKSVGP